jgi:hypothetical protein
MLLMNFERFWDSFIIIISLCQYVVILRHTPRCSNMTELLLFLLRDGLKILSSASLPPASQMSFSVPVFGF